LIQSDGRRVKDGGGREQRPDPDGQAMPGAWAYSEKAGIGWISVLFMLGSFLFAVGSLAGISTTVL